MIKAHTVSAYWEPRREARNECAKRLSMCLRGIVDCSALYSRWYRQGWSRREALSKPIDHLDLKQLAADLEARDQHFDDLGFGIGLWNGLDDEDGASISGTCGLHTNTADICNSVSLKLPSAVVSDVDTVRRVMMCMVSSWSPAWAAVYSDTFIRKLAERDLDRRELFIDWMLYLREGQSIDSELVEAPAQAQQLEKGDLVICTQPGPIDLQSADDARQVNRVRKLLAEYSGFV